MKKLLYSLIILFTLSQCNHKKSGNLVGNWQLQQMVINGTPLSSNVVGEWKWIFSAEGEYHAEMQTTMYLDIKRISTKSEENGLFSLKGEDLVIQPVAPEKWPSRSFTIQKLDSVELELNTQSDRNKSSLRFRRIK
ncbi:MAG: hypothetical protein JWO06_3779 [Bacteroidota bacterium]|nr:hypothetical protein [Bacteroidota bacterium]